MKITFTDGKLLLLQKRKNELEYECNKNDNNMDKIVNLRNIKRKRILLLDDTLSVPCHAFEG